MEALVKSGEIEILRGTVREVSQLFEIFDKYCPGEALLVGPPRDD